jgi:pSer/pThr/pTyr-binding forkhead associated (FHA) protein
MIQVKLVVLSGRPQGKSLLFPVGAYMFGRGTECHIRPNSELVSRQHCQLLVSEEKAILKDLGSRNGTLLNGEAVVGERPLNEGDHLQVGPLVFEVHLESAVPLETVDMLQNMATQEFDPFKASPSSADVPAGMETVPIKDLEPKCDV